MKLRAIGLTFAIVAMACGSATAQVGGSIGIFSDQTGASCDIITPLYDVNFSFYVLAKPNTANTAGGVNGAELRIVGDPSPGGIITVVPNAASNVALGNLFEDATMPLGSRGGANIAFPTCQLPDGQGFVMLYQVKFFTTDVAAVTDVTLTVDRADPPSNPSLANCPLINACDAPVFTALCVTGGRAYMNPTVAGAACTEVAVRENTWSEVKSLYSN